MDRQPKIHLTDDYPEKIVTHTMRFHIFDMTSISSQLNGKSWSIAHEEFDNSNLPNILSSDLRYDVKNGVEVMTGTVRATKPDFWYRQSTASILEKLKHFIDTCYVSQLTTEPSLSRQTLEVSDQYGTCISTIETAEDTSNVLLTVRTQLDQPDEVIDYYESVKHSVELWGYLHDFITLKNKSTDQPALSINDIPRHDIFVGGAQSPPEPVEMLLLTLLEEYTRFGSEIPTPPLGVIDFKALSEAATGLSDQHITEALKTAIVAKRIFYRYANYSKPLDTRNLVYLMQRQRSLRQQSLGENNRHD
jgi:hypothetical protein